MNHWSIWEIYFNFMNVQGDICFPRPKQTGFLFQVPCASCRTICAVLSSHKKDIWKWTKYYIVVICRNVGAYLASLTRELGSISQSPILCICGKVVAGRVYSRANRKLTEGPPSLNKGNFRIVHKEWDSSEQKVWFRLEISIKYGYIFTLPCIITFHSFLQSSSFEPLAASSCGILNVDTFVCPVIAFKLHQILQQEIIQPSYIFFLRPSNLLEYLQFYTH